VLAKDLGIPVEERPLSVEELQSLLKKGLVSEAFGSGTAAVASPIHRISIQGSDYSLSEEFPVANLLSSQLEDIRFGKSNDVHRWNYIL
jgi:branched-chain amino acid aminotransferase